jgi:hypothetical protein
MSNLSFRRKESILDLALSVSSNRERLRKAKQILGRKFGMSYEIYTPTF